MKLQKKLLRKQKNTTTLNAPLIQSMGSGEVGQTLTDGNRLGDLAELYTLTWLWDEGYEVFHNAGCTGPVDIVALKDGEVHLFDVKHNSSKKANNARGRTPLQKKMGVKYIMFNPKTRKLRIVKHRS